MKLFYSFTFLLFTVLSFSQDYTGKYLKKINSVNGEIFEYSLNLNDDNSYSIKIYRNLNQKNSIDEFFVGNGKWKTENKKVLFFPDLSNEKNEIDLSNTTARFDGKNKSALVFFNSNISWNLNVGMQKIN
jgi:hypothetical protein